MSGSMFIVSLIKTDFQKNGAWEMSSCSQPLGQWKNLGESFAWWT